MITLVRLLLFSLKTSVPYIFTILSSFFSNSPSSISLFSTFADIFLIFLRFHLPLQLSSVHRLLLVHFYPSTCLFVKFLRLYLPSIPLPFTRLHRYPSIYYGFMSSSSCPVFPLPSFPSLLPLCSFSFFSCLRLPLELSFLLSSFTPLTLTLLCLHLPFESRLLLFHLSKSFDY